MPHHRYSPGKAAGELFPQREASSAGEMRSPSSCRSMNNEPEASKRWPPSRCSSRELMIPTYRRVEAAVAPYLKAVKQPLWMDRGVGSARC